MRGHKGFKFRIYPSEKQQRRLLAWEAALRFLWNLALEHRKLGLGCPARLYPNAFDQISELKALRAEVPFLADVPRNVCAQLLVELDRAWQRCFKRLARAPRWKRKGRDILGLTEPHPKVWRLMGNTLRFPKLGNCERSSIDLSKASRRAAPSAATVTNGLSRSSASSSLPSPRRASSRWLLSTAESPT